MNANIDARGLSVWADHLEATAERAPRTARAKLRSQGDSLLRGIKARAPRRAGDYADSWGLQHGTDSRGNPTITAGTNHPAGFRLERGFHGTDSLGRHFAESPGHPHVAPAARAAEEPLEQAALEILDDL
jgi:hypothetical protein